MNDTPTPLGSTPPDPRQPYQQPAAFAPVQPQQLAPSQPHISMPQPAAPVNMPQPGYPVPPGYPGSALQPGAPSIPLYAPGVAPAPKQPDAYSLAGAFPQSGYGPSALASVPLVGVPEIPTGAAQQTDERGILAVTGLIASIGSLSGLVLGVLLAALGQDAVGGDLIFAVTPLAIVAIVLSAMGRGPAKRRWMGTVGLVVAIIALVLLLVFYALVVIGLAISQL